VQLKVLTAKSIAKNTPLKVTFYARRLSDTAH
jgi:hypothetical protein